MKTLKHPCFKVFICGCRTDCEEIVDVLLSKRHRALDKGHLHIYDYRTYLQS